MACLPLRRVFDGERIDRIVKPDLETVVRPKFVDGNRHVAVTRGFFKFKFVGIAFHDRADSFAKEDLFIGEHESHKSDELGIFAF